MPDTYVCLNIFCFTTGVLGKGYRDKNTVRRAVMSVMHFSFVLLVSVAPDLRKITKILLSVVAMLRMTVFKRGTTVPEISSTTTAFWR